MKLMNLNYLPLLFVLIILFSIYFIRYEQRFFKWIKRYFFLERSFANKTSSAFLILAVSLLLTSLLDFRGPETKHEADIPDQKTIIIIDSSASMLAEDVRPNRFKKAIVLARHFIKKAAGHQIAVVLFSDTQKRLVPFTDDIDLLDARVGGLSKIEIQNGGSNIRQAIAESLQYFKTEDLKTDSLNGNILVFTDSESNSEKFNFKIPDTVNLAMIGVGTARGASIPLRNRNGVFKGYKSYNGQKVISKLDENFLKSFQKIAKNYKYWVSTSFTIPTENILDFFRNQHRESLSKGLVRSRPVYAKYILVPALLLYLFANILTLKPAFMTCFLLFGLMTPLSDPSAQEGEEKSQKELDMKTVRLLNEMKKGQLDRVNKFKIAEGLLVSGRIPESKMMYDETFKEVIDNKEIDEKIHVNYGTLFLLKREVNAGALIYEKLFLDPNVSDKIKEVARQNILLALADQKQNKSDKEKEDKKNQKKGDKPKDSKGKKQSEGEGDPSEQKKKEKENKKENKKGKESNKDKKNKEDEKKNNKKKDSEEKGKKQKKKKTLEEKEEEIRKKRKMIKIPAMLKQIMSDDSQLQKKYLDTSTKNKSSNNKKKDW
ncbi:MAG: VWA domain-containing protein [Bacteriovoracaceae bacterium]|jgi:Ca-activated chloride channel homolog|nr:VWA domain-containing protein [Bacteriovoracaceae bacterium]